jgi:hypothetical protein
MPQSPAPSSPSTPRQQTEAPLSDNGQPDAPDQHQQPSSSDDLDLAKSLALLARKIGSISDSKPKSTFKPRSPDVFDGTDSGKIDAFLFQCRMYFNTRRSDFSDDESRVTFALSYLKGSPLDWFQVSLLQALEEDGKPPDWMEDYEAFCKELLRLFGPRDPVTDATQSLESLRYKDSGKATRYTIEFNRHSYRTGWNDQALARQYYKGLPDRLKDEISRVGKPADLVGLQELVATLDQRYWERQSEITRDKRQTPAPSNQHKPTSSDSRSDTRQSTPSTSTHKPSNSPYPNRNKDQKKPSSSATQSTTAAKPNLIASLLGPDGKLKPEERKRRMDQNLCLRCGGSGHTVQNCPQTSKVKSTGRAATVASSSSAPATAGKA